MIAAILFWAANAAAEPLSDRIQREYTLPALAAVQEAVAGREASRAASAFSQRPSGAMKISVTA